MVEHTLVNRQKTKCATEIQVQGTIGRRIKLLQTFDGEPISVASKFLWFRTNALQYQPPVPAMCSQSPQNHVRVTWNQKAPKSNPALHKGNYLAISDKKEAQKVFPSTAFNKR